MRPLLRTTQIHSDPSVYLFSFWASSTPHSSSVSIAALAAGWVLLVGLEPFSMVLLAVPDLVCWGFIFRFSSFPVVVGFAAVC
jgi:hypothetical protein